LSNPKSGTANAKGVNFFFGGQHPVGKLPITLVGDLWASISYLRIGHVAVSKIAELFAHLAGKR